MGACRIQTAKYIPNLTHVYTHAHIYTSICVCFCAHTEHRLNWSVRRWIHSSMYNESIPCNAYGKGETIKMRSHARGLSLKICRCSTTYIFHHISMYACMYVFVRLCNMKQIGVYLCTDACTCMCVWWLIISDPPSLYRDRRLTRFTSARSCHTFVQAAR